MQRRTFIVGGMAAAALRPAPLLAQTCQGGNGQFVGDLDLRALDGGRMMKLLKAYRYIDPAGLVWDVPAGVELDGASIPRIFWSITGGPWDGPYRNASVIHDWYCKTHSRPWEAVHRMFYSAMLANCTSLGKAGIMFAAVWAKGPRWTSPNRLNAMVAARLAPNFYEFASVESDASLQPSAPDMTVERFQALADCIAREHPGPAQIEVLASG